MPFRLRKAPKRDLYWVVDPDGKHHSKDPLPKERAEAQRRALYAAERREDEARIPTAREEKAIERKMEGGSTEDDIAKLQRAIDHLKQQQRGRITKRERDANAHHIAHLQKTIDALKGPIVLDDDDRRGVENLLAMKRGEGGGKDREKKVDNPLRKAMEMKEYHSRNEYVELYNKWNEKMSDDFGDKTVDDVPEARWEELKDILLRSGLMNVPQAREIVQTYKSGKIRQAQNEIARFLNADSADKVLGTVARSGEKKASGRGGNTHSLHGAGPIPELSILQQIAKAAYSTSPPQNIGPFKLRSYTPTLKFYVVTQPSDQRHIDTVVVGIRGTNTSDKQDLWADTQLAIGRLEETPRWKKDLDDFNAFMSRLPDRQSVDVYGVAHSLGSAILDAFLKKGLIKQGVSYNGAISLGDAQKNIPNRRIYQEGDPLLAIMGRSAKNVEIRPKKQKKESFFGKVANAASYFIPYVGLVKKGMDSLDAHALDNFTGGTHRINVLKKLGLPDEGHSLADLAKASGIPLKTLQEVYNRGIGAYSTNPTSVRMKGTFKKGVNAPMSRKLSKEQWAMARVYSFIDKNPKHDTDLRDKKKVGGAGTIPAVKRFKRELYELMRPVFADNAEALGYIMDHIDRTYEQVKFQLRALRGSNRQDEKIRLLGQWATDTIYYLIDHTEGPPEEMELITNLFQTEVLIPFLEEIGVDTLILRDEEEEEDEEAEEGEEEEGEAEAEEDDLPPLEPDVAPAEADEPPPLEPDVAPERVAFPPTQPRGRGKNGGGLTSSREALTAAAAAAAAEEARRDGLIDRAIERGNRPATRQRIIDNLVDIRELTDTDRNPIVIGQEYIVFVSDGGNGLFIPSSGNDDEDTRVIREAARLHTPRILFIHRFVFEESEDDDPTPRRTSSSGEEDDSGDPVIIPHRGRTLRRISRSTRGRGKKVCMPKKEYLAEHKQLKDVLARPTPAKLRRELAKQTAEVKTRGGSKVWGKTFTQSTLRRLANVVKVKQRFSPTQGGMVFYILVKDAETNEEHRSREFPTKEGATVQARKMLKAIEKAKKVVMGTIKEETPSDIEGNGKPSPLGPNYVRTPAVRRPSKIREATVRTAPVDPRHTARLERERQDIARRGRLSPLNPRHAKTPAVPKPSRIREATVRTAPVDPRHIERLARERREIRERETNASRRADDEVAEIFGMGSSAYLRKARANAKAYGLDPKKLKLGDGKHKLSYDGVGFGLKTYKDFLLLSAEEKAGRVPKGTAEKKRNAYRARAMKIKGDWKDNKISPNNLAIHILWA